jgi:microcystin degradation protein MlrC
MSSGMTRRDFIERVGLGSAALSGLYAVGCRAGNAPAKGRPLRFLVGQMAHESNSFVTRTPLSEFQRVGLYEGAECLTQVDLGSFGGIVKRAQEVGNIELVPTVSARHLPSGPPTNDAYRYITGWILDGADQHKASIDGVLLALHGAMAAEGVDDAEGELLQGIRRRVGPNLPIVVTLDKHANISELAATMATLSLAYNDEPHIDAYDRGVEAVDRAIQIVRREIKLVQVRYQPPMILPAINMATRDEGGPMEKLMARVYEMEKLPGVINANVQGGFYGSDLPHTGVTTLVATNGDRPLAEKLARELGDMAWNLRHEFVVPLTLPEEAVKIARTAGEPVLLVDEADDPAGGGYGDIPVILAAMLKGGITSGGVTPINDAETAIKAHEVGVGKEFVAHIGGKHDPSYGKPVEAKVKIVRVSTGPLNPAEGSGGRADAGRWALLDVHGIIVFVTEFKVVTENVNPFEWVGYDVRKMQAIASKGLGLHMRKPEAYGNTVKRSIAIDSPGPTSPNLKKIGTYTHLRRPIFPLDLD